MPSINNVICPTDTGFDLKHFNLFSGSIGKQALYFEYLKPLCIGHAVLLMEVYLKLHIQLHSSVHLKVYFLLTSFEIFLKTFFRNLYIQGVLKKCSDDIVAQTMVHF